MKCKGPVNRIVMMRSRGMNGPFFQNIGKGRCIHSAGNFIGAFGGRVPGPLLPVFPAGASFLLQTGVDLTESTTDQSGNANPMVVQSGVTYSATGGPRSFGPQLVYDGTGAINAGALTPRGAYTMLGWMRRTGLKGNIISGDNVSHHAFWASDNTSFHLAGANRAFNNYNELQDPAVYVADSFMHCAITYDGSSVMTIYKNGVQVATTTGINPIAANGNVWIGAWNNTADLAGGLCDMALYERVLTPAEIKAAMGNNNVLLLGDSLTEGVNSADGNGFRKYLAGLLDSENYTYNFVGDLADGTTDFDRNHRGDRGIAANTVRDNVASYLDQSPAEIVLLHIGTNDLNSAQAPAGVAAEVNTLLTNIYTWAASHNTTVHVVLAKIIPDRDGNLLVPEYNDELQTIYDTRRGNGDPISIVDMEHILDAGDWEPADNLHPLSSGYEKMAAAWYSVLAPLLSVS